MLNAEKLREEFLGTNLQAYLCRVAVTSQYTLIYKFSIGYDLKHGHAFAILCESR